MGLSGNLVAGPQVESRDYAWWDMNVAAGGEITRRAHPEKSAAAIRQFEYAVHRHALSIVNRSAGCLNRGRPRAAAAATITTRSSRTSPAASPTAPPVRTPTTAIAAAAVSAAVARLVHVTTCAE
jgi:hypothetical protein